jgi:hypothetical protein
MNLRIHATRECTVAVVQLRAASNRVQVWLPFNERHAMHVLLGYGLGLLSREEVPGCVGQEPSSSGLGQTPLCVHATLRCPPPVGGP